MAGAGGWSGRAVIVSGEAKSQRTRRFASKYATGREEEDTLTASSPQNKRPAASSSAWVAFYPPESNPGSGLWSPPRLSLPSLGG